MDTVYVSKTFSWNLIFVSLSFKRFHPYFKLLYFISSIWVQQFCYYNAGYIFPLHFAIEKDSFLCWWSNVAVAKRQCSLFAIVQYHEVFFMFIHWEAGEGVKCNNIPLELRWVSIFGHFKIVLRIFLSLFQICPWTSGLSFLIVSFHVLK